MFLKNKKLIISDHVKERYRKRLLHNVKRESEIENFIRNDLSILNIKKVGKPDKKGVYKILTKRNVIFICRDSKNGTYVLTTYGATQDQKKQVKYY